MDDYVEVIGLVAGACTTIAYLPQLIKVVKTGSTKDISLLMYTILCTGLMLWTIYGIAIHSISLVLANAFTLILACGILRLKIKEGRSSPSP